MKKSRKAATKSVQSQPIRKAWSFCPKCGAAAGRKGRNPFRCEACEFTHFFSPVSAVGGITCDSTGRVLLLVRGKDPGKGKYGLPGGFIDAGETAEEALAREIKEEIGLTLKSHQYLATFPNEYVFHGFALPVTDMFFIAEVESFDDIATVDGEITSWHFCHPGPRELRRMAFTSNCKAMELFLSLRSAS